MEAVTLADAFLADFEDSAGEDSDPETKENEEADNLWPDDDQLADAVEVMDVDEVEDDVDIISADTVEGMTNLLKDAQLKAHIAKIDELSNQTIDYGSNDQTNGFHNRDDEYRLIVASNEFNVKLDNEVSLIYKFLCDSYSRRVKELEQLIPNPVDYAKVVKRIGNNVTLANIDLGDLVPAHVLLTVTMTITQSSTSKPLTEEELKKVNDACDAIIELDSYRRKIYEYVESRMGLIAPNLSAITGPEIAAKLIGLAGGISQIANMPSCNLQVLGAQKAKNFSGFASTSVQPHMGVLSVTDIILNTPNELKRKALRLLAAKCALAARVDSHQDSSGGEKGIDLREQITSKIAKWQEPPPPKAKKALPKPDMRTKTKRGGRRYRRRKELMKQTELMKQKNRVIFGVAEQMDEYTGESFGTIGVEGSGTLRVQGQTKQRALSKARQQQLQQKESHRAKLRRVKGASSNSSGLASTIALTPVQGMELVNPDFMKEKAANANQKYFSSTSNFLHVGPNKKRKFLKLPPKFHEVKQE